MVILIILVIGWLWGLELSGVVFGVLGYALVFFVLAIAVVLFLVRVRVPVGFALLVGSLIILFYDPSVFFQVVYDASTSYKTWFLVSISYFIALMTELYRETGLVDEMGYALIRIIRSPILALMIVPGVIGLLPVAGGALMSAPIVDVLAGSVGLSSLAGVYVNVWFRHIIFISYPLTQSIIVASTLSSIPVEEIALRNSITTLFMAFVGYVIALRRVKGRSGRGFMEERRVRYASIMPFLASLVLALFLRLAIGDFGMVLGVLVGILLVPLIVNAESKNLLRLVYSRKVLEIALAAYAIMLFKSVLEGTRLVDVVSGLVRTSGIPLLLLLTIIPFAIGYGIGSIIMALTITIPVASSITSLTPSIVSIVYVSGFLGHLISPTHLCLVYTSEYFHETITRSYKYLLPSVAASMVFNILYNMVV